MTLRCPPQAACVLLRQGVSLFVPEPQESQSPWHAPPAYWTLGPQAVLTRHLFPQDIYENLDLRQRRASSPGYIDSPTYSRQGMSPTFSRSPHHYYRSGKMGGRKGEEEQGFRDSPGFPKISMIAQPSGSLWPLMGSARPD